MRDLVESAIRAFDQREPVSATIVEWVESWPAFRQPDESLAIASLRSAAELAFDRPIPSAISGPSNIGNYLASLGIPAAAGFGVTYDNVHATDEWCEVKSIRPVYQTYRAATIDFTRSFSRQPGERVV